MYEKVMFLVTVDILCNVLSANFEMTRNWVPFICSILSISYFYMKKACFLVLNEKDHWALFENSK